MLTKQISVAYCWSFSLGQPLLQQWHRNWLHVSQCRRAIRRSAGVLHVICGEIAGNKRTICTPTQSPISTNRSCIIWKLQRRTHLSKLGPKKMRESKFQSPILSPCCSSGSLCIAHSIGRNTNNHRLLNLYKSARKHTLLVIKNIIAINFNFMLFYCLIIG